MDIQRPSNARAKKIRRIIYGTLAVLFIAGVTVVLGRLRPAAPSVDAGTIWTDSVKRGPMLREVRGDRKSTRLNSSHSQISYAVFCLTKKNKISNVDSIYEKEKE